MDNPEMLDNLQINPIQLMSNQQHQRLTNNNHKLQDPNFQDDQNKSNSNADQQLEFEKMLTQENTNSNSLDNVATADIQHNIGLSPVEHSQEDTSQKDETSSALLQHQQEDYNAGQITGQASDSNKTATNSESQPETGEDTNDDEAFIALCADNSSVLNNDPSRRYYINKLYRPLNGGQSDDVAEEPQDDELLLYQELEYLESAAQELTDGRHSVQLTKILEDDDGDDDNLLGDVETNSRRHREDPLDRLQLTTIIESFDSFPSSPLIDTCNGRDPLISEASVCGSNIHDKPDSTHIDSCPSSGRSSANSDLRMLSSHITYDNQHHHHHHQHHHHQYDTNGVLDHMDHKNDTHFLNTMDSIDPMNPRESQYNRHNQQQQIQNNQHHQHYHTNLQINHDNTSEMGCLQPVSSSHFMSPSNSTGFISPATSSTIEQTPNLDNYDQLQFQTKLRQEFDERGISNRLNKQQATNQNDLVVPLQSSSSDNSDSKIRSTTKTRVKRKRSSCNESSRSSKKPTNDKNSLAASDISSTQFENCQTINTNKTSHNSGNNIYKTKESQRKHIITTDSTEQQNYMTDNEELSIRDDEASNTGSSVGRRRNPSMNRYRRCTANARERIRMREINLAFEKLKKVVPVEMIQQICSGDESDQASVSGRKGSSNKSSTSQDGQSVKLTKITTLKLAVSYIAGLSELLNQHQDATGMSVDIGPIPSADTSKEVETSRSRSNRSKSRLSKKTNSETSKGRRSKTSSMGIKAINDIKLKKAIISKGTSDKGTCNQTQIGAATGQQVAVQMQTHQRATQQPVIISNNVMNRSLNQTGTLIPLHMPQKPQYAFATNQQTVAIGPSNGGQDRPSFVTPVAVAILGIPTNSGFTGINGESQPIQILGIHNPNQQQQHQQQQHVIQTNGQPQRIQQIQGNYNLVTQQPQQVTFTLNDINGLSVLRLANPQDNVGQQPRTIQLQTSQPTSINPQQQQQTQIISSNGQLNYAAIQPLQVSQIQSGNMQTTIARQANNHQQQHLNGNIQFRQINRSDTNLIINQNNDTNSQQQDGVKDVRQGIHMAIGTTNTGIQSDCINVGTNSILQHNNSNINNNAIQQAHSGQLMTGNMVSLPTGTQFFHHQTNQNCNNNSTTNLIYLNPAQGLQNVGYKAINHQQYQATHQIEIHQNGQQTMQFQAQQQQQQQQLVKLQPDSNASNKTGGSQSNKSHHQCERMKFVTQFSAQKSNGQEKNLDSSEANIRQLVASLTTSIRPNAEVEADINHVEQSGNDKSAAFKKVSLQQATTQQVQQLKHQQLVQQQLQQQQQQPKRTYRFHNYDGNMITNHLYHNSNNNSNNGQDKNAQQQQQQQQQNTGVKKSQQQQHQSSPVIQSQSDENQVVASCTNPSQRSRQNSLSSTCSTTSSSSSSVSATSTSFSAISPNAPMLQNIMVESPPLESNSESNTSTTATPSTAASSKGPQVVGESIMVNE